MTRDEVIKALEICTMDRFLGYRCASCQLVSDTLCNDTLDKAALALLKEEPKRGRWEPKEFVDAWDVAGYKTWALKRQCTNCGFIHYFIEDHMGYVFCPNCGAKMEAYAPDEKNGRWIEETDRERHWHCSVCGYVAGIAAKTFKYCPECGARNTEADDEHTKPDRDA